MARTAPKPGDGVSARSVSNFLCNFLDDQGIKPVKVLKQAGLRHETQADWHSGDAVHALYMASQRFMPPTFIMIVRLHLILMILTVTLTRTPFSLILTLIVRPEFFPSSIVGRVQGFFSCISLSSRFLRLHMWRACH